MSQQIVAEEKAKLEAAGVNLLGPCGAFSIVKRVAWRLRGQGYKLMGGKHPAQNHCAARGDRFSVDFLMRHEPDGWKEIDILVNAGGNPAKPTEPANVPTWQVHPALNPEDAREPFDPDGQPSEPPPVPPSDLEARVVALETQLTEILHQLGLINRYLAALDPVVVRYPLRDYIGEGRVGWFGGSFTIVSKPL